MNVENKHTMEDLKKMKSLPLWRKIQITQTRILEYGIRFNENIYVSFSGGKDSTVLLDIFKKHPAIKFEKETGLHPIIATMTEESKQRESNWLMYGCNGFEKGRPTSNPMSFWTSNDVMEYINTYKIPYCDKIYGEIIIDPIYNQECFYSQKELNYCKNFKCTGRDRTGCIFCMFGCHLEKPYNRFQLLKKTHRKLWDYCMGGGEYNNDGIWVPSKNGLGMAHVLDFCEIKYE